MFRPIYAADRNFWAAHPRVDRCMGLDLRTAAAAASAPAVEKRGPSFGPSVYRSVDFELVLALIFQKSSSVSAHAGKHFN